MKRITKKLKTEYIKSKLSTSTQWALKCLTVVYGNQTQDEQQVGITHHHNNKGFTGTDANFMTSLAQQYERKGYLSNKQMAHVMKRMKKYHKQVSVACDETKLIVSMMADGVITEEDFESYKSQIFVKAL